MRRNSYPTGLSDAQWRRIAPWVPEPKPGGRPAKYSRREIVSRDSQTVETTEQASRVGIAHRKVSVNKAAAPAGERRPRC